MPIYCTYSTTGVSLPVQGPLGCTVNLPSMVSNFQLSSHNLFSQVAQAGGSISCTPSGSCNPGVVPIQYCYFDCSTCTGYPCFTINIPINVSNPYSVGNLNLAIKLQKCTLGLFGTSCSPTASDVCNISSTTGTAAPVELDVYVNNCPVSIVSSLYYGVNNFSINLLPTLTNPSCVSGATATLTIKMGFNTQSGLFPGIWIPWCIQGQLAQAGAAPTPTSPSPTATTTYEAYVTVTYTGLAQPGEVCYSITSQSSSGASLGSLYNCSPVFNQPIAVGSGTTELLASIVSTPYQLQCSIQPTQIYATPNGSYQFIISCAPPPPTSPPITPTSTTPIVQPSPTATSPTVTSPIVPTSPTAYTPTPIPQSRLFQVALAIGIGGAAALLLVALLKK